MITKRTDVTINENIKTLFEMLVSSGENKNHHVINATKKNIKFILTSILTTLRIFSKLQFESVERLNDYFCHGHEASKVIDCISNFCGEQIDFCSLSHDCIFRRRYGRKIFLQNIISCLLSFILTVYCAIKFVKRTSQHFLTSLLMAWQVKKN